MDECDTLVQTRHPDKFPGRATYKEGERRAQTMIDHCNGPMLVPGTDMDLVHRITK